MNKMVIIYTRTATDNAVALVRQRTTCRRFARECDYSIIEEHTELGSGQAAYLPLREAAIKHAATQGAALLCAEPSRLTRSAPGLASILAECQAVGVAVVFTRGA
jgi:DNA invertase Pin-like site-specific DNA recombinase